MLQLAREFGVHGASFFKLDVLCDALVHRGFLDSLAWCVEHVEENSLEDVDESNHYRFGILRGDTVF